LQSHSYPFYPNPNPLTSTIISSSIQLNPILTQYSISGNSFQSFSTFPTTFTSFNGQVFPYSSFVISNVQRPLYSETFLAKQQALLQEQAQQQAQQRQEQERARQVFILQQQAQQQAQQRQEQERARQVFILQQQAQQRQEQERARQVFILQQQQQQPTQYYTAPQFPSQPPAFSFNTSGANYVLQWNPQPDGNFYGEIDNKIVHAIPLKNITHPVNYVAGNSFKINLNGELLDAFYVGGFAIINRSDYALTEITQYSLTETPPPPPPRPAPAPATVLVQPPSQFELQPNKEEYGIIFVSPDEVKSKNEESLAIDGIKELLNESGSLEEKLQRYTDSANAEAEAAASHAAAEAELAAATQARADLSAAAEAAAAAATEARADLAQAAAQIEPAAEAAARAAAAGEGERGEGEGEGGGLEPANLSTLPPAARSSLDPDPAPTRSALAAAEAADPARADPARADRAAAADGGGGGAGEGGGGGHALAADPAGGAGGPAHAAALPPLAEAAIEPAAAEAAIEPAAAEAQADGEESVQPILDHHAVKELELYKYDELGKLTYVWDLAGKKLIAKDQDEQKFQKQLQIYRGLLCKYKEGFEDIVDDKTGAEETHKTRYEKLGKERKQRDEKYSVEKEKNDRKKFVKTYCRNNISLYNHGTANFFVGGEFNACCSPIFSKMPHYKSARKARNKYDPYSKLEEITGKLEENKASDEETMHAITIVHNIDLAERLYDKLFSPDDKSTKESTDPQYDKKLKITGRDDDKFSVEELSAIFLNWNKIKHKLKGNLEIIEKISKGLEQEGVGEKIKNYNKYKAKIAPAIAAFKEIKNPSSSTSCYSLRYNFKCLGRSNTL
jgi:hypothetical protein